MITLTIKDIPPQLHRRLKERAETNGRSLNSEVISCLLGCVQSVPLDIDSLMAEARMVRGAVNARLAGAELMAMSVSMGKGRGA